MKEKIVLGLSGGVDSAVAARLLQERYDVTGLYLDIGLGGTGAADAAAVAERLGIPFETADIRAELEREVCAPFAADYRAGRTPLPCARCNPAVKFPALFALAGRIGARYVSTGHYARVENGVLKKGMPANDQSYMLARLTREQLQKVIFPLGNYEKTQVRALARDFGIPVADKPDSMEICFIPDGDYAAWLERRGFSTPEGNFVDKEGKVLGRHRGIHCYTLGQGRGLGVSGPHRYYVTALRPDTNEVVLSDGSDLGRDEVRGTEPNWLAVDGLTGPMEVTAGGVLRRRRRGGLGLDCMREKERTMDMKKLLGLALACALLLTGCGARGGDKGEELGDNTIRPLELTEEEAALLKLVGGSDAEYGLFECAAGEGVSDCTVEVLSWEDGAWQTVAEGGVSISAAGTRRLGVVLSGDKITVNVQDGGTQYSYAPRLDGMDRGLETGRASVWLEEDRAMTIGERTPLYLEIYDDGEGVGIPPLPGGFSDLANLNQYDRAYAVAVTLKG